MVDAIREILGLQPLYAADPPSDYHWFLETPTTSRANPKTKLFKFFL